MPKNTLKNNHKSITFYALHLPVLLLLLALLGVGGFLSSFLSTNTAVTNTDEDVALVLGDDDDDDDKDDNSGKGSSDDKDDDKDDDSDDDDDKDDDRDDDDDDKDDNSGKGSSDDKDDKDDDEDSVEFNSWKGSGLDSKQDIDDDRTKTLERVANPDGTFTVTEYEEKDDGEVKVEIRTFDANGNKIRVEKYERDDDGEEKSRVKVYDEFGNKLSDFRLETEDGKELELRLKEGETELSRVRFDVEKGELLVRTGDDDDDSPGSDDDSTLSESDRNRLRIRLFGNNFVVTRNGVDALTTFPLVVDDATGTVAVSTPSGEVTLNAFPDSIEQSVKASDDSTDVVGMELVGSDELAYVVTGVKSEKLLGVFAVQIPNVLIYDAETGAFLRDDNSFTTKLLDLFSF